jgi:hypothetical protein
VKELRLAIVLSSRLLGVKVLLTIWCRIAGKS